MKKIDKAATDYASAVFGLGINMSTYAAFLSGVHFAETELQNIIAEFVIWISNNRCYAVISEVGILWYIGRSDISYTYTELFAKFMDEKEVRP